MLLSRRLHFALCLLASRCVANNALTVDREQELTEQLESATAEKVRLEEFVRQGHAGSADEVRCWLVCLFVCERRVSLLRINVSTSRVCVLLIPRVP